MLQNNLNEEKIERLTDFLVKHEVDQIHLTGEELSSDKFFHEYLQKITYIKSYDPSDVISLTIFLNWGYCRGKLYNGEYIVPNLDTPKEMSKRSEKEKISFMISKLIDRFGLEFLITKLATQIYKNYDHIVSPGQAKAIMKRLLKIPLNHTERNSLYEFRKKLVRNKRVITNFSGYELLKGTDSGEMENNKRSFSLRKELKSVLTERKIEIRKAKSDKEPNRILKDKLPKVYFQCIKCQHQQEIVDSDINSKGELIDIPLHCTESMMIVIKKLKNIEE